MSSLVSSLLGDTGQEMNISTEAITEIITQNLAKQVTDASVSMAVSSHSKQFAGGNSDNCHQVAITDVSGQLFSSTSVFTDGKMYQDTMAEIENDIVNEILQKSTGFADLTSKELEIKNLVSSLVQTNMSQEQLDILTNTSTASVSTEQICSGNATDTTQFIQGTASIITESLQEAYKESDSVQKASADISNSFTNKAEQVSESPMAMLIFVIMVIVVALIVAAIVVAYFYSKVAKSVAPLLLI